MSEDIPFRPIRGLPGQLPEGETLLWQGEPDFRATALRVFHIRKVAIYFALLAAWRFAILSHAGASVTAAATGALVLVGLGLAALAILGLLAFLIARTTVYSITSRRVVMHIGVALPITFNLPFKVIASAAVKLQRDGTGSLPLSLTAGNRLSYPVIWPHARPWRLARAEPTLRCIAEAAKVAQILAKAVADALPDTTVQTAVVVPQPAATDGQTARPLTPAAA